MRRTPILRRLSRARASERRIDHHRHHHRPACADDDDDDDDDDDRRPTSEHDEHALSTRDARATNDVNVATIDDDDDDDVPAMVSLIPPSRSVAATRARDRGLGRRSSVIHVLMCVVHDTNVLCACACVCVCDDCMRT